jgi:hypothetical protein
MIAVKKVEFASDRMSHIILRGCLYDIILNVHAPTNDKINDMNDILYEELERIVTWRLTTGIMEPEADVHWCATIK